MVDYSKIHEVIAETNEGILLAEYQPEYAQIENISLRQTWKIS